MTAGELLVIFGLSTDSSGFKKAEDLVKGLQRTVRAVIGVDAIKHLAGFVEEAAHAGTHMLALGKQFGISTDAVQRWSYTAKQSGSNIEELGVGIRMLERTLRAVHEGGGSKLARRALRDFGITADDIAKAMKSPDGLDNVMLKLSASTKRMGVDMAMASGLTTFFGQRAKGIAGDLIQGPEAIRAQWQKLRDMGGIIPESQLENLKQVDNTIVDLRVSVKALFMEAVAAFGPQLVAMLQDALHWFRENKDLISGAFTAALQTVAFLFEAIGTAIVKMQEFFNAAFNGNAGALALMSALSIAMTSPVIPKLLTIVTTLGGPIISALKAMAPALEGIVHMVGMLGKALLSLVLSPAGAILAAVAAIAVAVYEVYEHWEAIRDAIVRAGEALVEFFSNDKDLTEAAKGHHDWLSDRFNNDVPATSPASAGLGAPTPTASSTAHGDTNVTTTVHVTNNGVKDAHQAAGLMGDSVGRAVRFATGSTGRTPR